MRLQDLVQYLVPFSFLAIWAITSLMNRESKPVPTRMPRAPQVGGRPGDPTMRWGGSSGTTPRRVNVGREDDIIILSDDEPRPARTARPRTQPASTTRRTARTKPGLAATRKLDTPVASPLVSGVNQGVNQQLATTIDLQPLTTTDRNLASVASRPNPPSAKAPDLVSVSKLAAMMVEPNRLREAFLMNELIQPPVSMRRRSSRHR